ncbi:MAG: polysaccharide deacetylase family protein [Sandaracinus sp.]|nr:polysaccharide deacetylase family protein [Sandaracinus sp.]MCB9624573.1 polysaccharide deacetylase family protein [Sandaracinus sp.]MCB9632593.1 polysaccharide deacetylase family protein [Sandaracinus sp.]
MMERLAALSVDLDEIGCYAAIHGLPPPSGDAARAIYRRAVPRFERLFDALGVPATFFVIGSDVDDENALALRRLHAAGHELANHSLSHFYDLTRRDRATQDREVREGGRRIEEATGAKVVGFRAPGYTITDSLFEVIEGAGYRYDSSVFPCPAYYGAKTAAIGAYALRARLGRGRASRSVVDDARVLFAPADPYRVGRPYWKRGSGLLELPIGVTRGARLPYIGTSVALSGPTGADLLTRQMLGRPLVSLELHGIDLSDADEDGLQSLRAHQPDLRKTAAEKEAALRAAVSRLAREGYRFVTLAEAAQAFG